MGKGKANRRKKKNRSRQHVQHAGQKTQARNKPHVTVAQKQQVTARTPSRSPARQTCVIGPRDVEIAGGVDSAGLQPILSKRQWQIQIACLVTYIIALAYLWLWWAQPDHIIHIGNFLAASFVLAGITLLPLYPLSIIPGGRKAAGSLDPLVGKRVAMIVTRAPSEPFHVVRRTLEAMLAQDVAHDTWLADEDPNVWTESWCLKNGVKLSTRRGIEDYHRKTWPRRTRCKEGNLAYFYDTYGYDNYDFVVQMDADHVPSPTYLREMLRPFADPKVGYVSAPSICDANVEKSWAARSRANVEGTLHGALQAGYNAGWAPLCIGSHYAVRTEALRQIGGLGPELAEDHSTTLMMNAGGWKGVHAVDAIAHGEGPDTFTDLITQEFQWSRSIVTILLQYLPQHFAKLPPRLKFQFAFSELWYPLFALIMTVMYALPIYALLSGEQMVGVGFIDFVLHAAPASLLLIAMVAYWQRCGWFRPLQAKAVSWEGLIFNFARWPWVLAGSLSAVWDRFFPKFVDFKITPKGEARPDTVPNRIVALYPLLAIGALAPVLLVDNVGSANGFYIFCILNAVIYALVTLVIVLRHDYELGRPWLKSNRSWQVGASSLCVATALTFSPLADRLAKGTHALAWDAKWFSLTEVTYGVSGAGRRGANANKVRFKFQWGERP